MQAHQQHILHGCREGDASVLGLRLPVWCGLIFLCSVLMRVFWFVAFPEDLRGESEILRVSLEFADTGTLANPYKIPTGPTAHLAPIYPILRGYCYRWISNGHTADLVRVAFTIGLISALYASLPILACLSRLPIAAGVGAGISAAFLSYVRRVEILGESESTLAAVMIAALVALCVLLWRDPRWSTSRGAATGLFCGFAVLVSPPLFFTICALAVLALIGTSRSARPRLISFILVAGFAGELVCLPWQIRNFRQLHAFVPFRDNLGLELYVSHHPKAQSGFVGNSTVGDFRLRHPLYSLEEATQVKRLGEIEYQRLKLAQALEFIKEDPRRSAALTASRVFHFWMPLAASPLKSAFLIGLFVSAVAGLWYVSLLDRVTATIFACIWVTFPIPYYLVQWDWRYRYPLYWTFYFLAAVAFTCCLAQIGQRYARAPHSAG